jgi:hypothetical protein
LRLSNNGNAYNEHLFSDSSFFKSFKSILPWSGRPTNLVIAMQAAATKQLLFTLSVDAKLRVWHMQTGQLMTIHDVSGAEAAASSYLLDPVSINLLALYEMDSSFLILTYCPRQPGLFKVFKGENALQEIFSFREEVPKQGLWRVFDVSIAQASDDQLLLHVLWKSDTLTLVQVGVVSLATRTVSWSCAVPGITMRPAEGSMDLLERWIFEPSRFSLATLRRALAASTTQQVSVDNINSIRQAQQLARQLLHDSVPLEIDEDTGTELVEQQAEAVRLRYLNLAQICLEIDRLASEPHALCRAETGEVLVAQSDRVSLIRQAGALEQVVQLVQSHHDLSDTRATCLELCRLFGDAQTPDARENLQASLRRHALADRTLSADDLMFVFYEEALEQTLSKSVVAAMEEAPIKTQALLSSLADMLPLFTLKLRGSVSPTGVTGLAGYVACQRDMATHVHQTLVQVLAVLLYYACHATESDVYSGASLFVKYLDAYKRATLVVDACSTILVSSGAGKDRTVFAGLAEDYKEFLPYRDFLERLLAFLISKGEGQVALAFCAYVGTSAFCSYLVARAKLLLSQADEAAMTFARMGLPLVSSPVSAAENKLSERLDRRSLVHYHLHVARLYMERQHHTQALRFCGEAEIALRLGADATQHRAVAQLKFEAALASSQFDEAYLCLSTLVTVQQLDPLRTFLTQLCESDQANKLLRYPFIGLLEEVDDLLQEKAFSMMATQTAPAYHRILYSWRIRHCNFRGAASALYRRLQVLRAHSEHAAFDVSVHLDLTEGYLAILNALRCMDKDEQWLIVGALQEGKHGDMPSPPKRTKQAGQEDAQVTSMVKRKLLSLKDVKAEYLVELHNMKAQLNELAGLVS